MKPRLAVALLVGAALVVVAIAASGTSPVPYADTGPRGEVAPTLVPSQRQSDLNDIAPSDAGGSLVAVFLVLVVAALVVVVGLLITVRLPRRRRRGVGRAAEAADSGAESAPDLLVRGAREALEELRTRTGGPPRDAVVLSWLRLEQAASETGAARRPAETPTEFTGALLARHRVDEQATGALRAAYQRARFGTAEVTDADARTAEDALERIVRDLGATR
ncbi:DUF4129 domain-containing protein [Actinosynnema sp. NPDC050436]|uniref:DUF4129 domain-containing protein n=1 Tax=Actinosynnema sp. NPDC050436 TaxID=3155659 RepID=UPI0033EBC3FA